MAFVFDPGYYLSQYPEVGTAIALGYFTSAYDHFVRFGAQEQRNPNAQFNSKEYAELNSDVSLAVGAGYFNSVWDHYVNFGVAEGRVPSKALAGFDADAYLALHNDVAQAVQAGTFKSAIDHYLQFGQAEGRSWGKEAVELTNGTDKLTANQFNAGLVYTPGGNDRINSLQDEDQLTGIGTNPTLTATLGNANDNGGTTITPKLTNIQTLNVAFTGSDAGGANGVVRTLNLEDATGLQEINVTRISTANTYTFDNLTEATTNRFSLDSISVPASVDFQFQNGVLAGSADSASLALKGVTMRQVEIQSANDLRGFETLTVTSQDAANAIVSLRAAQLENLIINGDKDLSIVSLQTNADGARLLGAAAINNDGLGNYVLRTIDASALTGQLTIDLTGHTHRQPSPAESGKLIDLAVTGGSANDTFIINEAVPDRALQINGGEGTDTLLLTRSLTDNPATKTVTTAIKSVEHLDLIGNNNAAVEVDTNLISDLATIRLRNENVGGGNATFDLDALSATAGKAITIDHAVTGSNGLGQNIILAQLADGSGSADEVVVTINTNLNTDEAFNFRLDTSAVVPTGKAAADHVVEQVTLVDSDNESNAVRLTGDTGTIVLRGGIAGQYLDLDASNLYQRDLTGATDNSTAPGVLGGAVRGNGLNTAKIDATAHVGDVTVRVETNPASTNGGQTILFGTGNDTVIFDETNDSTAGLTISDTVSGGEGADTLVLHGNEQITVGASEWTHVSGFETIRVVGNNVATNNGPGLVNAYNLILTTHLVDNNGTEANGVRTIAIVNDNGNVTADETGITIDARALTETRTFSYDGEENVGADNNGATADRFILSDASINGQPTIDGGDENAGIAQNSDVLEVRNSAVVTTGDLVNISNIGFIELRSDAASAQSYTVQLDNSTLDRFDSSQAATTTARETFTVRVEKNATVLSADTLNLEAASVTGAFNLNIGGSHGKNTIDLGNAAGLTSGGNDTLVLWGGFAAGTYAGVDAAGRDLSVLNDVNGLAAGVGTRAVNDDIDLGAGNDTLVTYGSIDLSGATLDGIENYVFNSDVRIKASQLLNVNVSFNGALNHTLTIVNDLAAGQSLDLSRIALNDTGNLWIDFGGTAYTGAVDVNGTGTVNGESYIVTASALSVDEGSILTFTLSTTGVAAGTEVAYDLSGTGIEVADFTGLATLTGKFTVGADGKASVALNVAADAKLEGAEQVTLNLTGKNVHSAPVTINDTSVPGSANVITVSGNGSFAGTDGVDHFVFDVATALADVAGLNSQATITGFDVNKDKLRIDLPTADATITNLADLDGQQGVNVLVDEIAGLVHINFGNDLNGGEAVTIELTGLVDRSVIAVEIF